MSTNSINVHIRPITSSRSGRAVANQYTIQGPGYIAFQSYDSLIAVKAGDRLTLGRHWDYSVTTSKYLWQWLSDNCWYIVRQLPDGKSGADRIRKAIAAGLIYYDPDMV